MGSNSKRQKGAEDRISQLPEDVRVHILSYLPTLYSVRTTVLSKAWHKLWTVVPTLDLEYHRSRNNSFDKFAKIIDKTLSLHNPPTIRKFRLHIEQGTYIYLERVRNWICTAMRHDVSELDLSFSFSFPHFHDRRGGGKIEELKLPTRVVQCKTLEVLKVDSNCITYPAISPGCFPSLKFANITATNRDTSSLRELFCNCPELLTLRASISAYNGSKVHEISINAPKLQNFVFYNRRSGHRLFPEFIMKDGKSLVKADIEIESYFGKNNSSLELLDRGTALFAGVSTVQYLYISGPNFVRCSLPNFSNLKQLKIVLFGSSYLEYLIELLKRSPKLEDLVLDFDVGSWFREKYVSYKPFELPENVPCCVVSHLKTVSIAHITGHDDQLDLVKYMLKSGRVLRNMTIVTCGTLLFETRHIIEEKFQREILMYPKISNICDVEVKFETVGLGPLDSMSCIDCGKICYYVDRR